MRSHEVLFDGTRKKPWGRMLFADESQIEKSAPVQRMAYGGSTARVRECATLLTEFVSSQEIASICGLTVDQARHAIHHLLAKGDLIREQAVGITKGRHGGQRYRWVIR